MQGLYRPKFLEYFPAVDLAEATPQYIEALAATFPYGSAKPESQKLVVNDHLLAAFGLAANPPHSLAKVLTAEQAVDGAFSYNYGGHQFGHWADQLGDGRAVVIGECQLSDQGRHELQLKGSGLTPFSRQGDGKAVLRSSLREYIASEALDAIGIPTTRALSLYRTGEKVLRDRFYDGRAEYEDGAIVCRTAPSFIRFGHFELLAARQQTDQIRSLLDYSCTLLGLPTESDTAATVIAFLSEVSQRTARLIALWQSYSFVHGVMNTDNMSILGLTIDYGPYGFMEQFDASYTPNTSDLPGRRYRYEQQPAIAFWNLQRLAECFLPLVERGPLISVLEDFPRRFQQAYLELQQRRFALRLQSDDDRGLIDWWMSQMTVLRADVNFLLRELSESCRENDDEPFLAALMKFYPHAERSSWQDWYQRYVARMTDPVEVGLKLCEQNPRFVPKNHVLHQLHQELAQGQRQLLDRVLKLIKAPFDDWSEEADLYQPAPDWACNRDLQMNSCSS